MLLSHVALCMYGSTAPPDLVEKEESEKKTQTDGRGLIEADMCPVFLCPQMTCSSCPYACVALFPPFVRPFSVSKMKLPHIKGKCPKLLGLSVCIVDDTMSGHGNLCDKM